MWVARRALWGERALKELRHHFRILHRNVAVDARLKKSGEGKNGEDPVHESNGGMGSQVSPPQHARGSPIPSSFPAPFHSSLPLLPQWDLNLIYFFIF